MLQVINGTIQEIPQAPAGMHHAVTAEFSTFTPTPASRAALLDAQVCVSDNVSYCGGSYAQPYSYVQPYGWWNNYAIYTCTDKTAKAIEVLKKLQDDKTIEVKSVKRFIELVESIAAIL